MAHRYITTAVITGTRVLSRAFMAAYRQASASSAYQKYQQKHNPNAASTRESLLSSHGLTLEEACKILNVKPPINGQANIEEVTARFKKLFDVNDPKKGGSFYLQSKILRARERIEREVRVGEEKKAVEDEAREGWKPKVFKDK